MPEKLSTFSFFLNEHQETIRQEQKLSNEAVLKLKNLRDVLLKEFELYELEREDLTKLLIRLLFCLFAEDIGMFQKDQFLEFLKRKEAGRQKAEFRTALLSLFETLNTEEDKRDKLLASELNDFPYVNGGLFAGKIDVPFFTDNSKGILLHDCSQDFNWGTINPTIFGSLFESMLQTDERHEGGMHYTSVQNIRKVTRPLFLDELQLQFQKAGNSQSELLKLQDKISNIRVFDPACGSGNFLTQTYIDLRMLENKILDRLSGTDISIDALFPKVSVGQFFGIEINFFATEVAKTAIQIAKCQMDLKTSQILGRQIDSLPLEAAANIVHANALNTDWNEVLPANKCDYIIGNPPFLGARNQSSEQKHELIEAFDNSRNCGNIDYVAAWFAKATKYMQENKQARTAFVATNSICQGEQVANIWKPLFNKGISIDFAHNTFRWENEAPDQAHVFCVIVGFSFEDTPKRLFLHETPDAEFTEVKPSNINAYLLDAPDVYIFNSRNQLCAGAPRINYGSFALDDGNFTISEDEYFDIKAQDSKAIEFLKPFVGAKEILHDNKRWCVWLKGVDGFEFENSPIIMQKVKNVKEWRSNSSRRTTAELANSPTLFAEIRQPEAKYIAFPTVSSERRKYMPICFLEPTTIASNQIYILPNASSYHFGILSSQFHNAWMRVVCGRLESRYRYSAGIVYNNFPWPGVNKENIEVAVKECVPEKVRKEIEQCAQTVLDARDLIVNEALKRGTNYCLADLYDPNKDFLFQELTAAHRNLDKAVEKAYGVNFNGNEEKIVAHLFELYQNLSAVVS